MQILFWYFRADSEVGERYSEDSEVSQKPAEEEISSSAVDQVTARCTLVISSVQVATAASAIREWPGAPLESGPAAASKRTRFRIGGLRRK